MAKCNSSRVPKYRRQRRKGKPDLAFIETGGKRTYFGPFDDPKSREAYARHILTQNIGSSNVYSPDLNRPDLTVGEALRAYLRFARAYYSKDGKPTAELNKITTAMSVVNRLFGTKPANDFGPLALKSCREAFIADRGNCRKLVNEQVVRIRRIFEWCASEELINGTICHNLKTVKGLRIGRSKAKESDPVKPVPDEYVDAIREHVSSAIWAAVQVQRLTGMRSTELLTMRGRDIDMTGRVWIYRPARHKTQHHGHARVVEIGPKAQAILATVLKPDVDAYLFDPRDAIRERASKAPTHRRADQKPNPRKSKRVVRARYDHDGYRIAIVRGCDAADAAAKNEKGLPVDSERMIPRWNPHRLRHNFATRIRKEFGVELARVLCGHRTIDVTELYGEIDRAKARDAIERIG